jgi:hypothetical protein
MSVIRRALLCTAIGLAVHGCATLPNEGRVLVPPLGLAKDQISFHISQCLAEARLEAHGAFAPSAPLTDQERAPLQNRSTVEFIVRGRPVVNADTWPTLWSGSLSTTLNPSSYGPADVSDRYVLCLLKRGYTWPSAPASK